MKMVSPPAGKDTNTKTAYDAGRVESDDKRRSVEASARHSRISNESKHTSQGSLIAGEVTSESQGETRSGYSRSVLGHEFIFRDNDYGDVKVAITLHTDSKKKHFLPFDSGYAKIEVFLGKKPSVTIKDVEVVIPIDFNYIGEIYDPFNLTYMPKIIFDPDNNTVLSFDPSNIKDRTSRFSAKIPIEASNIYEDDVTDMESEDFILRVSFEEKNKNVVTLTKSTQAKLQIPKPDTATNELIISNNSLRTKAHAPDGTLSNYIELLLPHTEKKPLFNEKNLLSELHLQIIGKDGTIFSLGNHLGKVFTENKLPDKGSLLFFDNGEWLNKDKNNLVRQHGRWDTKLNYSTARKISENPLQYDWGIESTLSTAALTGIALLYGSHIVDVFPLNTFHAAAIETIDQNDHLATHDAELVPAETHMPLSHTEVIDHFTMGTGGDVLNISDVLTGIVNPANATELGNYLNFSTDGTNTILSIDSNGDGSGPDHVIVMKGIDLFTEFSASTDMQIIQALLDHGNLMIDNH